MLLFTLELLVWLREYSIIPNTWDHLDTCYAIYKGYYDLHDLHDLFNTFLPSSFHSTKRIPVLYIFGREAIDLQDCVAAFKTIYPDNHSHIILMYDVRYSHVIGKLMPLAFPNKFQADTF